jgi:hypothetical protein
MHAKGLIILLITITVLTAVVFAWYNRQISLSVAPINVVHQAKTQGLGSTIYTEGSNPASNVPETNPIKNTVTNPFSGYVNPFDTK